jgi:glucose/arabinose dehydrogenase
VKSKPAALLILVVVLGLLLPAQALAEFTDFPGAGDFQDELVVDGVPAPTAIDWLPGNVLLIATQGGVLYRWNGAGAAQQILSLSGAVCAPSGSEMGLLGLAVDPQFSGNRFIYLYYTHKKGGGGCDAANRANRVSRFTVDGNGIPGGETVLIDNIAAPGGNHNAGDLQFDRNGLLYISVGDGGSTPDTARRLNTLNGKILRIDRNGGIPADNPIQGPGTARCSSTGGTPSQLQDGTTGDKDEKKRKKKKKAKKKRRGSNKKQHKKQKRRQQRRKDRQDQGPVQGATANCQEIFATGLRNPFRIAFDSNDTDGAQQFFINDVGGGAWEEIDLGAPGADYGWNIREGPCVLGSTTNCTQPSGFSEPIYAYKHQTGCRTITGGAFVPANSSWPDAYWGDYLFADLACDTIFARDATTGAVTTFATGSGAIHLRFGPNDELYYTTYEGAAGGQVRRIFPKPPPP